eukprot:4995396-Amphidinium_carterae.1
MDELRDLPLYVLGFVCNSIGFHGFPFAQISSLHLFRCSSSILIIQMQLQFFNVRLATVSHDFTVLSQGLFVCILAPEEGRR